MDLALFLAALVPSGGVGVVGVVAYRRRRTAPSPLILNRYTLAVEPDVAVLSEVGVIPPPPQSPISTG